MEITVCICTHNRPAYVRDCLEGLGRQTAPRTHFEVLIVDSASTHAVAEQLADLAAVFGARLIRQDRPGVSAARNASAAAAGTKLIAYIDDDAIPDPDWIDMILRVARGSDAKLMGGRILPKWEAPLPSWWPASLIGVLSIIEHQGHGEYRTPDLPLGLEPYAANMMVDVAALQSVGGFGGELGRYGAVLLSDEEVRLAWTLQDAGHKIVYDSRITVRHQIQASRLNPAWLLRRLYWQGASTVTTRRLTGGGDWVWWELPRRIAVLVLLGPTTLLPRHTHWLIGARWRVAYAAGFVRTALGWDPARMARRMARQTEDRQPVSNTKAARI